MTNCISYLRDYLLAFCTILQTIPGPKPAHSAAVTAAFFLYQLIPLYFFSSFVLFSPSIDAWVGGGGRGGKRAGWKVGLDN